MTSQLFILGAHKIATSSMVTMLNNHPRILCLYKVNLVNPFITRYGKKLLNVDPKLRPFFGELNDGIYTII
jgi:folate-dependent phosphoribosylglycinamide formyltransferase PurN